MSRGKLQKPVHLVYTCKKKQATVDHDSVPCPEPPPFYLFQLLFEKVFDDAPIQVMSPDTHAPFESEDNMDTIKNSCYDKCQAENCQNNIGIGTGNWGCGAFGGNPEIKCMIQWLAASQALRPFIHYYTFEQAALMKLGQVTEWIMLHKWTVGDLWNMLVEYSSQKLNRKTSAGFLNWLLPGDDASSSEHLMCE